jgi:hypothetical protein
MRLGAGGEEGRLRGASGRVMGLRGGEVRVMGREEGREGTNDKSGAALSVTQIRGGALP